MSSTLISVLDFQSLLQDVSKNVNIEIADADIRLLKDSNYKLCFAKKVGDYAYNVVWQSYDNFLKYNNFSWTPQYQIFGTNKFQTGVEVQVQTNSVNIGLGQTCTLDNDGILHNAVSGGDETCFTLINEYGIIHPGVMQLSKGPDGKMESKPIYVAKNEMTTGKMALTPVEKVMVWFEQDIETSTMFTNARSNSKEVDLTSISICNLKFENQKWLVI